MIKYGNTFLILTALLLIGNACSTTQTSTQTTESSAAGIPSWYLQSGFESDSLSFSGFASAIAADSLTAVQRAENQAKANLENHIARKMENIRADLEKSGSLNAIKPDFILTLRNAHAKVESEAAISRVAVTNLEGHYRAFARASINKPELLVLLQSGFEGKKALWDELTSSEVFAQELQN